MSKFPNSSSREGKLLTTLKWLRLSILGNMTNSQSLITNLLGANNNLCMTAQNIKSGDYAKYTTDNNIQGITLDRYEGRDNYADNLYVIRQDIGYIDRYPIPEPPSNIEITRNVNGNSMDAMGGVTSIKATQRYNVGDSTVTEIINPNNFDNYVLTYNGHQATLLLILGVWKAVFPNCINESSSRINRTISVGIKIKSISAGGKETTNTYTISASLYLAPEIYGYYKDGQGTITISDNSKANEAKICSNIVDGSWVTSDSNDSTTWLLDYGDGMKNSKKDWYITEEKDTLYELGTTIPTDTIPLKNVSNFVEYINPETDSTFAKNIVSDSSVRVPTTLLKIEVTEEEYNNNKTNNIYSRERQSDNTYIYYKTNTLYWTGSDNRTILPRDRHISWYSNNDNMIYVKDLAYASSDCYDNSSLEYGYSRGELLYNYTIYYAKPLHCYGKTSILYAESYPEIYKYNGFPYFIKNAYTAGSINMFNRYDDTHNLMSGWKPATGNDTLYCGKDCTETSGTQFGTVTDSIPGTGSIPEGSHNYTIYWMLPEICKRDENNNIIVDIDGSKKVNNLPYNTSSGRSFSAYDWSYWGPSGVDSVSSCYEPSFPSGYHTIYRLSTDWGGTGKWQTSMPNITKIPLYLVRIGYEYTYPDDYNGTKIEDSEWKGTRLVNEYKKVNGRYYKIVLFTKITKENITYTSTKTNQEVTGEVVTTEHTYDYPLDYYTDSEGKLQYNAPLSDSDIIQELNGYTTYSKASQSANAPYLRGGGSTSVSLSSNDFTSDSSVSSGGSITVTYNNCGITPSVTVKYGCGDSITIHGGQNSISISDLLEAEVSDASNYC